MGAAAAGLAGVAFDGSTVSVFALGVALALADAATELVALALAVGLGCSGPRPACAAGMTSGCVSAGAAAVSTSPRLLATEAATTINSAMAASTAPTMVRPRLGFIMAAMLASPTARGCDCSDSGVPSELAVSGSNPRDGVDSLLPLLTLASESGCDRRLAASSEGWLCWETCDG